MERGLEVIKMDNLDTARNFQKSTHHCEHRTPPTYSSRCRPLALNADSLATPTKRPEDIIPPLASHRDRQTCGHPDLRLALGYRQRKGSSFHCSGLTPSETG